MNHLELYDDVSRACSKLITQRYSTSFTLGIRTLAPKYHAAIYAIYGFVRYADEIVDTFHGHDKATLLRAFEADTYAAIAQRISLNPVLHAFQWAVNAYAIDHALIAAFLRSMEMDLDKTAYDALGYEDYIYGSAEVVGLMCMRVFAEGDAALYDRLYAPARSLGKAFQKVNFLRDLKSDYEERGRVYFPGVDFARFSAADKAMIEADIQRDFDHAYTGIVRLPAGARWGVYLAYRYYLRLFAKIKALPPQHLQQVRVRVPDAIKAAMFANTLMRRQFALWTL